jgi:Rrf2 family protein
MLQLSKATDYALLFLTNLAKRPGHRWNVREAALSLNISRRFLANIVHQLARSDIIVTSKGAKGGIELRRAPEGITVRDVVEVFEGSLALVECQGKPCDRSEGCCVHPYWQELKDKMLESFSNTTINDLGGN